MSMRRGITGLLVLSSATALLVGCATGNADTGTSSATVSAVTGWRTVTSVRYLRTLLSWP